jgi:hypothetical protein
MAPPQPPASKAAAPAAAAAAATPTSGAPSATLVDVLVPVGAAGGNTIEVTTPGGRRATVVLPPGSAAGDMIRVKLAPEGTAEQLAAVRSAAATAPSPAAAAAAAPKAALKRRMRKQCRPMAGDALLGVFSADSSVGVVSGRALRAQPLTLDAHSGAAGDQHRAQARGGRAASPARRRTEDAYDVMSAPLHTVRVAAPPRRRRRRSLAARH